MYTNTKKTLVILALLLCFAFVLCACNANEENAAYEEESVFENAGFIQDGSFTVDVATMLSSIEYYLNNVDNKCSEYQNYGVNMQSTWKSDNDGDINSFVEFYKGSSDSADLEEIREDESEIPDGVELFFDLFKQGDSYNDLMEEASQATMLYMRAVGFTEEEISDEDLHELAFKSIDRAVGGARDESNVGTARTEIGNASIRSRAVAHGESNRSVTLYVEPLISMIDSENRDAVLFGSYEQDNDTTNGKEQIEWTVLDRQDDKCLIISNKALDCQSYNGSKEDVTWEDSSIRAWLNNEFLNEAFDNDEKNLICETTVPAEDNTYYDVDGGNDTSDKIFFLSNGELETYFPLEEARQCEATAYAQSLGSYSDALYEGKTWWMLRTPGENQTCELAVQPSGSTIISGRSVDDSLSIRPVLWVKLEP